MNFYLLKMKRVYFIFCIILGTNIQALPQKIDSSADSLFMIRVSKLSDSIFLIMNGRDTNLLNTMSKSTWVYDSQGNVVGGSKMKIAPNSQVKLVDTFTKNYFVLDSAHVVISAFNLKNEIIWSTDPYIENKIEKYRTDRPIIISIEFGNSPNYFPDKVNVGLKVIWITYNNTQFGFIDLVSGKYYYCGQD